MKITLRIDGQNKEFVQEFIPARMFRKTMEIQAKLGKGFNEKDLDSTVSFMVDVFGNQFTIDQFYDGLDARNLVKTVVGIINEIVEGSSEAVGADANSPNA